MKLTIVTINKNNGAGLRRTLDSLSCQLVPAGLELQHMFLDGASIDNSLEIFSCFGTPYSSLTSQSDSGIYNAMNKALSQVHDGWVMFLNSGDTLSGNSVLFTIVCELAGRDEKAAQFRTVLPDRSPSPSSRYYWIQVFLGLKMHAHPSFLFRRDFYPKLNFNEVYSVAADYDFVLRTIYKEKVYFSDSEIVLFEGGGVSSNNVEKILLEMGDIRKNFFKNYLIKLLMVLWNQYFFLRYMHILNRSLRRA